MRCGTEADVRATAPVRRVVLRSKAIARGVRDLVELVVLSCQSSVGGQILFGVALVIRCSCCTSRYPTIQRCAGLDGQTVEGAMSREQGAEHVEVTIPIPMQLFRQPENQIERDVFDAGPAQRVNSGADARGVMGAVHPFQDVVVERLGAEGDAVYSGALPGAGGVGRDVFGVGLQRHFDVYTLCGLVNPGLAARG